MNARALPLLAIGNFGALFVSVGIAQDTHTDVTEQARRIPDERVNRAPAAANAPAAEVSGAPDVKSARGLQKKREAAHEPSDAAVAAAVEDELAHDPLIALDTVVVEVRDGKAILQGTVNALIQKDRAANLARTVRGVMAVENNIVVEPHKRPNSDELEAMVQQALVLNPATEAYSVSVTALPEGQVTLTGSVDSWAERLLTERVAKGVSGVTEVRSDLEVDPGVPRRDTEVMTEIERMLTWDAYVDATDVDVSVRDGVAKLSGSVDSAAEKNRAVETAAMSGVGRVDARELSVTADANSDRGKQRAAVSVSDEEIEQALRMRLRGVPELGETQMTVAVNDGVATLRGTLGTLQARRIAYAIAEQTHGIERVRDRMRVRAGNVPADEIEQRIVAALALNPITESYEVTVDVEQGGTARLSGLVSSWFEKGVAENVVSGVRGVRNIENRLNVERASDRVVFDPYVDAWSIYNFDWYQPAPATIWKRDAAIIEDIQNELRWSPFVDESEIHVAVDRGVATLTGTVDSWAEAASAQENAFEGGAAGVVNRLEIENQT